MTLWSGRFSTAMGSSLWDLSESYSYDHVLYPFDIAGSKAHVRGLMRAGLVSDDEGTTLITALDVVLSEFTENSRAMWARSSTRRVVATIKWPRRFDSSPWMHSSELRPPAST